MNWSFEEDFIVCNFYLSYVDCWQEHIDEVMTELKTAGFGSRDKNSVKMRIQNYRYLHIGKGLSNVAKQTKRIYNVFKQRTTSPALWSNLQPFIESNYIANTINNTFAETPDQLTYYVPIEPLGPSFQDILFKFIDDRGMKDSDVYNASFVDRGTFSHIRKGDRGITKKTIKQLCFGLKLSYDEAVILMESAGFAFRKDSIADLVVAYFLKNCIYDIFAANAELYERNEELLFAQ